MSLFIPAEYKEYNLISIDPGLNNIGIAVYRVNKDLKILHIKAWTVDINKVKRIFNVSNSYPSRSIKIMKFKSILIGLLLRYKPYAVITESAFYNPLRPSAYGPLSEVISHIVSTIMEVNPNIFYHSLEPLLIKKMLKSGYSKGKLSMLEAVSKVDEITDVLKGKITDLDDHGVDAIAVGYSFLSIIKNEKRI